MADYVLMTDSTSDLNADLLNSNNIEVFMLHYFIDGVEYEHNLLDEESAKFYELMRQGKIVTTAQVNTDTFINRWTPLLEQGKDIIYMGFSSALSGTLNSAILARDMLKEQFVDRKLIVIDSTCASLGEGLLVLYAAQKRDEGLTIDELASWVEDHKLYMNHWYTPDSLVYLKRGGRLSGASAFIGTVMDIKPVLNVDLEGRLVAREKVKGRKKAIKLLYEKFCEEVIDAENQMIGICHADCREEADYLASLVLSSHKVKDILITFMDPIIGAHTGPGLLSIYFFGVKRYI